MRGDPLTAAPLSNRSELVSLAERINALHALRLAVAAVVLLASALAPASAAPRLGLVSLVALYVLIEGCVEALRRLLPGAALALVGVGVLLDGAFVVAVLYRTGGPGSYLAFLVELHLIGVSLLVSYRTGLKLAIWYTVLFGAGHFLVRAGMLTGVGPGRPEMLGFARSEVFNLLAFWLVAVATATFSSLNERELRRSQFQLHSLAELGRATSEEQDAGRLPGVVLERVCETFAMKRGVVVWPDGDGLSLTVAEALSLTVADAPVTGTDGSWHVSLGRMLPFFAAGAAPHGVSALRRSEVGQQGWPDAAVADADATGRPGLLRHLSTENPVLRAALPGAERVVVLPLVATGRPPGAIVVECQRSLPGLAPRTVDMLAQFAAHAALALHSAALHAEVQRLAETDPLTGLVNRRILDEALAREVARSHRTGASLGVVLIDIDHFKAVNDSHGHQAGDDVLRRVGAAVRSVARATDIAARFGGEEFAVLLPECTIEEAVEVAERLRRAVALPTTGVAVTASAGVTVLSGADADPHRLVALADEALYRAKRGGRDRVEIGSPPPPRPPARSDHGRVAAAARPDERRVQRAHRNHQVTIREGA